VFTGPGSACERCLERSLLARHECIAVEGGDADDDSSFGFTADYAVLNPSLLALPANKNGEGSTDPVTHVEAYALKLAKGRPKFLPRVDVAIANQWGDLVLNAKKPARLLVPTGVDAAQPAPHDVDHFLCYQAKAQKPAANCTCCAPSAPR
jgi:hypothetical protein